MPKRGRGACWRRDWRHRERCRRLALRDVESFDGWRLALANVLRAVECVSGFIEARKDIAVTRDRREDRVRGYSHSSRLHRRGCEGERAEHRGATCGALHGRSLLNRLKLEKLPAK